MYSNKIFLNGINLSKTLIRTIMLQKIKNAFIISFHVYYGINGKT